ncbi:MAG: SiaB family protein kinase [Bacteroidota bacterium]|nr:SiaB family protein kinase [Bacteroidota bacterium]
MDLTQLVHNRMMEDNLLFVYRGDVTDKNSLPLLTLLENEMKDGSYGLPGQKRLFMFVLECLQNMAKHGDHLHYGDMSLVAYSKTTDGYNITTGNTIAASHKGNLKERLDLVKSLNTSELKKVYRQILETSEFSKKGGAGLGLFEMAAKTGNKLDYDFVPVDAEYSYFILSKTVDSAGMGVSTGRSGRPFDSGSVVSFEKLMADNNIYLIWSGHISGDIGEEVLSITESRLNDEDVETKTRRRIFSIMVEILENVSKYNPGRETEEKLGKPVAIVRLEDGHFVLTTGNLILNSGVDELKGKLDNINTFSRLELKEEYYKSLSKQRIDTDSTGNMGLIAVARKSGGKLDYQFKKVNDLYSYYMLTVRIND